VRTWTGMALAYLVGALVFLWPIPVQLDTAVWGDRFDAWTTLWLIGHLAERLQEGNLDPVTQEILYPLGYNIWSFGHVGLQGIGAIMVRLGLPVVATYNLLLIAGVWTSALAAHLLGKELTGSHAAAAIAGVVFASSPYLYSEGGAGCIELVAAGLLPLHAWSLVRLVRVPSWRRCGVAAGILALIGPFNWYYTLFAGLFGLGFCGWQLVAMGRNIHTPRYKPHRRGVALILLSMAIAAVVNLPLIDAARQETPSRPTISADRFTDQAAWERATAITEGRAELATLTEAGLIELDALQVHLNSTSLLGLTEAAFTINPLGVTPGALAYGVAFLGLAVAGRRVWGWLALGAGFTLLSLGPYLNLEGALLLPQWAIQVPLPYRWASDWLPFFDKAYRPYRFAVMVLECAAIMGAIGAATLIRQYRRAPMALAAVVIGLVGFTQPLWTNAATRPIHDATTPGLYDALGAAPPGAVIEVPIQYQPLTIATAQQQYFQLTHDHPLLNTNQLIRRPDLLAFRDYAVDNSFLLAAVDLGRPSWPITVEDQDIQALLDDGFRYVVVRDRVVGDASRLAGDLTPADLLGQGARQMLESLLGEPAFSTEDGSVYDLSLAALETGRARTFTANEVQDLSPSYDVVQTSFTLSLDAGDGAPLYTGAGRQIALWAMDEGVSHLNIEVIESGKTTRHPVTLEHGFWRHTTVDLPAGDIVVRLAATGGGAEVAITNTQVLR